MRGRGLKPLFLARFAYDVQSPLMRGRGLKLTTEQTERLRNVSPLMRGRGLKRWYRGSGRRFRRRPSCGGVD